MNLYAYVSNDPVNFTDPLGLERGQICWTTATFVERKEGWVGTIFRHCFSTAEHSLDGSLLVDLDPDVLAELTQDGGRIGAAICRAIDERVARTQPSLGGNYVNSWRWNSLEALRYDLWRATYNARGYADWGVGLGTTSLSTAIFGRYFPNPQVETLSIGSGLVSVLYLQRAAAWQAALEAVTARLEQLRAQQAGRCPVRG